LFRKRKETIMENIRTFEYSEETFQSIVELQESEGYILDEIRNITEGDFLVFRKDEPVYNVPTMEERLEALESAMLYILFQQGGDM